MPRSRTLALQRQSDAVSLFRQGRTFDQIASEVGYAHRGTAHKVVTGAFRERIAADIDLHRELEVARLDAIQAQLWDQMEAGDVRAAKLIVDIITQRSKLLGLYDHPKDRPRMLVEPRDEGNAGEATSLRVTAAA